MIATAATLNYDYPPEIVASVANPAKPRAKIAFHVPDVATNEATNENAEFLAHFSKLKRIAIDPTLWPDHSEPPAEFAIMWAQVVMQQLQGDSLAPTRVVASAEGGIGICFVDGNRYADIECLNSGAILGVTSNKRARPIVWEIEQSARGVARASERIREFVGKSKTGANAPKWPFGR
jgi:hypothetical protein